MYTYSGLGSYAAQAHAVVAARIAAPECTTRALKAAANVTCKIFNKSCKTANLPVCPPAVATPASAMVTSNALVTPPPAPAAPPKKRAIPTRDHKIPVTEPLPEPEPPVIAEPAPGVPMWAWLVGGAAVVGGVAYFATRKKAA